MFGTTQGKATQLVDVSAEAGSSPLVSNGKRRFVVAGLAYGNDHGHFLMRKFVGTLRNTGYEGDIILGVSKNQDEKVLDYYKKRGVTPKVVTPSDNLPLAFIRFYEYKKWIEPYADDDLVLVADTADTFFQSDPFIQPEVQALGSAGSPDLMLFAEYLVTIGTQLINRGWISGCWGEGAARKLNDAPVLCSGTTLGTKKAMVRYLDAMLDEMEVKRKEKAGCRSAKGIDQGYHNYLFNQKVFGTESQIKLWQQGEGPINTVGTVCSRPQGPTNPTGKEHSLDDRLKRDDEGWVLNEDGSKSAVVHQWNRCWDQLVSFVCNEQTCGELGE